MLTDRERDALKRWYGEDRVIDEARALAERKDYLRLEELLHKGALIPLGRHDELPDYMRDDEGGPLFPSNCDPRVDKDQWQDVIEVGWEVIKDRLGLSHDDVHRHLASEQDRDWNSFIESVERRKKERGLT